VAVELGRRLISSGVVAPDEIEAALFLSVVRGVPITRALVDRGALPERLLEEELARRGGVALRHVVGNAELMAQLPRAMCRRLAAVPTRVDAYTGTVDVAASDPLDPHVPSEFGFHLEAPIRVLRAPLTAIEDAIRRVELGDLGAQAFPLRRARRMTPAFPHGAPDSSIPPPPTDEQPIPLVRRLGVALVDPDDADGPATIRRVQPTGSGGWEASIEPVASLDAPKVSFPSTPPIPVDIMASYDLQARAHPGDVEASPPTPRRGSGDAAASLRLEGATVREWATSGAKTLPPPVAVLVDEHAPPRKGPPSLPFDSPDGVMKALREATARDEVVKNSLRGMRMFALRVALFVVKRDGYHGWRCNVEFGDADAFQSIVIPLDQPSVLATATATSVYLGPIPNTAPHAGLLVVMGSASRDVAVGVARAGGRPAMVLVADELGDTMTSTRRMTELADVAGEALSRLLLRR